MSNAMTKQHGKDVVLSDGFLDTEYTGFENVDRDSLVIPFLKIAQKGSPGVEEESPAYIEGLKPGFFYNAATQTVFGEDLNIVLLTYYRSIVKWGTNLGDFQGYISVEQFEKEKSSWKKDGSNFVDVDGNRIQDTRNFFVVLPDYMDEGIMIYSMYGSGISASKKLLTRTSMLKYNNSRCPLYGAIWKLSTMYINDGKHTWYQIGDRTTLNANFQTFIPPEMQPVVLEAVATVKEYQKQADSIDMSGMREDHASADSSESAAF